MKRTDGPFKFTCPKCGAEPEERCLTPTKRTTDTHMARYREYWADMERPRAAP